MMPLSSTPTVVNAPVFPLNGVLAVPASRVVVISQAVNRSATY